MLHKNDLPVVEENVRIIIKLILDNGCINSPDINRLKLIIRNIEIFHECNEGWDELIKYIFEDWDMAMRRQEKIIDCYILSDDIDLKAQYNEEFEKCCKILDKLFGTSWFNSRKWYTKKELIQLGITGITVTAWNDKYSYIVRGTEQINSQIDGISREAWTYAKCLGVASTDEELIKWFGTDIPAFGYISLLDMSKLENGENIVKYFLANVPVAFP